MKKTTRLLSLLLAVLLLTALCGCGSSSKYSAAPAAGYDAADRAWYDEPAEAAEEDYAYETGFAAANGVSADAEGSTGSQTSIQTEKIIYSASSSLETTEFDATIEGVYALVEKLGGFMESTSVSGNNYYNTARGSTGSRYASFSIRVPSRNFNALTSSLSDLGYVTRCNTYSENVTRRYYDTAARLNAYKTQETRLLEMLAIADTVEDMLAIQRELTEVQYEIDSLTSTLANLDNDVAYSTVSLSVQEVSEYAPEPVETLTFGQRLARGFRNSCKGVGEFFVNFTVWFVGALPVLVVLALFVILVLWLIRRILGSREVRRARREARAAKRAAKKAEKKSFKLPRRKTEKKADAAEAADKTEDAGSEK